MALERPRTHVGSPKKPSLSGQSDLIIIFRKIGFPIFIKIDVEGAEALVIEGALHTICEAQPIIAFEHGGPAHQYGGTSNDIYRMLCDEAGLRIFDMNGNGPIGLVNSRTITVDSIGLHIGNSTFHSGMPVGIGDHAKPRPGRRVKHSG